MSLPVKADLYGLDVSSGGQPWVSLDVPDLGTTTMDYVYMGEPFYGHVTTVVTPPVTSGQIILSNWSF